MQYHDLIVVFFRETSQHTLTVTSRIRRPLGYMSIYTRARNIAFQHKIKFCVDVEHGVFSMCLTVLHL